MSNQEAHLHHRRESSGDIRMAYAGSHTDGPDLCTTPMIQQKKKHSALCRVKRRLKRAFQRSERAATNSHSDLDQSLRRDGGGAALPSFGATMKPGFYCVTGGCSACKPPVLPNVARLSGEEDWDMPVIAVSFPLVISIPLVLIKWNSPYVSRSEYLRLQMQLKSTNAAVDEPRRIWGVLRMRHRRLRWLYVLFTLQRPCRAAHHSLHKTLLTLS